MCNCGKKRENHPMSVTQILDKVLPYTREELRCGSKKRLKIDARMKLAKDIKAYMSGANIQLPENVKPLVRNDKAGAKRLV